MTVLEYERRFQDLSIFASVYLPTEQHQIERLRDGLRQELRMGLAALQFPTVRDFIVAAQSLEAVAAAGRQEGDGQVLWEQKSVKSLHRLQGDLLF